MRSILAVGFSTVRNFIDLIMTLNLVHASYSITGPSCWSVLTLGTFKGTLRDGGTTSNGFIALCYLDRHSSML